MSAIDRQDATRQRLDNPSAYVEPRDQTGVVPAVVATAQALPERMAVDDGTEAFTYREIVVRAASVSRILAAAGVEVGDAVGVMASRRTATVVNALGVLGAGAVYVPLLPDLPPQRLVELASIAGLRAVIGPAPFTHLFSGVAAKVDPDAVDLEAAGSVGLLDGIVTPVLGAGAYVMFTSGSTGPPKGVRVSHGALAVMLDWARSTFSAEEMALFAATTSFGFDPSILELFGPLSVGGTVRVLPNVMSLADLGADVPVTMAEGVPSALSELLRLNRFPSTVRTLIVGGESMSASLARRLYSCSSISRLLYVYGPTEATVWTVASEVCPDAIDPVPIGREIPDVKVYITDPTLREVAEGEVGELCVGGPNLADGYLRRSDLTAERFVASPLNPAERWYRTGDLARRRSDGQLEFKGRIDDQVKIRGYRIEPGEVQMRLNQHPCVGQAYVAARQRSHGLELVAWVACLDGAISGEELCSYLAEHLPAYLVPAAIAVLDSLPVGPRGKIDATALLDPGGPSVRRGLTSPGAIDGSGGRLATSTQGAPGSLTELVNGAIVEVLGTGEAVGPDDDFFTDLGGTSFLAVRLVARLEELLDTVLPLSLILSGATVTELASALRLVDVDSTVPLVVNGNGADTPLVLIHAWVGGVLRYRALAPYLPASQPIIGIGVPSGPVAEATIGLLAEQALVQLRNLRPHGPYVLGGHSAGGLVALEMARRLRAAKEEIRQVLLIDTPAQVTGWRFWSDEIALNWADWKQRTWPERVERIRTFTQNRKGRFAASTKEPRSVEWRLAVTNRAAMRAIHRFRPDPYDGDVTLYWTHESVRRANGQRDLGWSAVVLGRLTTEPIEGTHDTIFTPDNAPGLAELLLKVLHSCNLDA